jgi:hypothetical protein
MACSHAGTEPTFELGHLQEQDPEILTGPDSLQQSIVYNHIIKSDKSKILS